MKEQLNWRYAVKRYDKSRRVEQGDLEKLREAIRMAPSSFGLQPFKVLFIEDEGLRKKLSVASFHQPQVTEASCLIVFAIETVIDKVFVNTYFENVCNTRGIKMEGNLEKHRDSVIAAISRKQVDEMRAWAAHQVYLALGFLLFAAAELKIDANAMEGFMPDRYDELLGLESMGLHAAVIAAVGYRHPDDIYQHLIKVRRPEHELFMTR